MSRPHPPVTRLSGNNIVSIPRATLCLCLSLTSITARPPHALAADPPSAAGASAEGGEVSSAERAYKQGLEAFKKGDYEGAVLLFMRVYRVSPNPNLVYNMARSFEELKRFDEAALYYQKYLELNPDAPDAREVELSIETLLRLGRGHAQEEVRGRPPVAPTPAQPTPNEPARHLWGWAAVGLGGALAVGGGVAGVITSATAGERDAATSAADFRRAQSEMRSSAVAADLMYVGAAVFGAVGAYLLLTDDPAPPRPQSGLQVSASPQNITLTWSF